jgi:ABC-2 type transport system permease protein
MLIGGVGVSMIILFGGFVFYNTNILNEYRTPADALSRSADYEKKYGQYKDARQPIVDGVKLHIELYPSRGAMDIRGTYRLINYTDGPIDSIHLATVHGVTTSNVTVNRPSNILLSDEKLDHHIYLLETPLAPGDSLQLSFEVHMDPKGFRNTGINRTIVENGTYFTEGDERWMPQIGYESSRELIKPTDRRKYKLPARRLLPSLTEVDARPRNVVHPMSFEAVIGTEADQVAVTTGELRRSWTENDRRYYHYVSSAPIGSSYSVLSAKYKIHEEQWMSSNSLQKPVTIKVYYHPGHEPILDHILPAARASLNYHTKRFSAYPFTHITIAERGGTGRELSAEAAFIDYGEGFTRFNPDQGAENADIPFAVTAHEMGHQWWGGQIHYAMSEGAAFII